MFFEKPDRGNHPDVAIRYYGVPVEFVDTENEGIAQILVKVNTRNPNTIYSLELVGLAKKESGPIDGDSIYAEPRHPDYSVDSLQNLPSIRLSSGNSKVNETVTRYQSSNSMDLTEDNVISWGMKKFRTISRQRMAHDSIK